jgi:AraC-like DNA-binding protein
MRWQAPVNSLPILGWSTRDVPATQLRDYAAQAIESGLESMSVEFPKPDTFKAELTCVSLDGVTIAHGYGEDLRCIHGKREIAKSCERNFHIVVNRRSSWTLQHRGAQLVRVGDAALMDSALEYEFTYPPFDNTHIQLSESWIKRWVPNPSALAGRVVLKDRDWGAALCSYVRMLTPEFLSDAPLPVSLIFDHVGALLALVANDISAKGAPIFARDAVLHARIMEVIRQRCSEPGLLASDVAAALQISLRTLHRQLASKHLTFGGLLVNARLRTAMRMLESKSFRRLTIGEIARRAGFSSASHFSRTVKAGYGRTPAGVRSAAGTRLASHIR